MDDSTKDLNLELLRKNVVDVNASDRRQSTPLHWAVPKSNNLDIVRFLLDNGADVHASNYQHYRPLNIAIQHNNFEVVLLLIARGALNGSGLNSSLITAIERNNLMIARILIDTGIRYNVSVDLSDALNVAISHSQPEMMEMILPHCRFLDSSAKYIPCQLITKDKPANKECVELLLRWNFKVDPASIHDGHFIYGAVANGHLLIVLHLLELGLNVNMVNLNSGLSLLNVACLKKHYEIVKILLKCNACMYITAPTDDRILKNYYWEDNHRHSMPSLWREEDLWDYTHLHVAVINCDLTMVRVVLNKPGIKLDASKFFNIVCIAVRNNCEEIVLLFLNRGIDVNNVDAKGKSLLHFCVDADRNQKDARFNIAKILLERGATSHIPTSGNLLLFDAINNGHQKTAQLLLYYNASIHYINPINGDTPLHKAIENNFNIDWMEAKVNDNQNIRGQTPLHLICKYKTNQTEDIINLLLQYKANIEATDAEGWTPLFVACYSNNYPAVKCLLNNNANVYHTDNQNLNALYISVKHNKYNSEVVDALLKHKINIKCIDKQGKSIFHIIAENNNHDIIENLVNGKASIDLFDKNGDTPLHTSIKHCHVNVTTELISYGADITILDKKNRSPLQIAMKYMIDAHQNCENYRLSREFDESNGALEEDPEEKGHNIWAYIYIVGLPVNDCDLKIVYEFDRCDEISPENRENCAINIEEFEKECKQEIEKMKEEIIDGRMTFYDLLKKSIYSLSRCARNKKILQALEEPVYNDKFPLYREIFRNRFRMAKFRHQATNSVRKYFNTINHKTLPADCVDIILDHLNMDDLGMIRNAMKSSRK
ncbi:ankyrin-1-like [Chelonus insularis]|uniref:ankyrin-1-like n=1 Tax=Chelonus insularis TaxID=460826 RepID=UPI00158885D6|nr:ankyrin-1-like [Chelonus insularis]